MTGFVSISDAKPRRRIISAVLLGGLVGALLGLLLANVGGRAVSDLWHKLSPREISQENVAVVLIDNDSLAQVGSWPWSRYYMARLLEEIGAQGPRVIGIDILFAEPDTLHPENFVSLYPELDGATADQVSQLPPMDDVLAQVMGNAPVILARVGVPNGGTEPGALFVDPPVAGEPPAGTLQREQVLTSIPVLDDVALGHGMINGPPDADGQVRRVPLTVKGGDVAMPGLAVELARVASGASGLEWQGNSLRIGDTVLPANEHAMLAVKLGLFPEESVWPAHRVLRGDIPPDAFAGKVVMIGLGADGTSDIVSTPLENEVYGIFVQAQAVDAILEDGWLTRPGWMFWVELAAGVLLVVAILFGGVSHQPTRLFPAIVLALGLPLISWLAFDQANILFNPVLPLMAGAAAAVALWTMRFLITRAERARLEAELIEQKIAAAEQEGELKAARRIQLSMVPGEETLTALDRRVEIGAILEPAKSVGGDFYDALKIDDDTLLFIVGDVTGKGVPAALFMALSKALTKSNLSRGTDDLAATVASLNRDLMGEADEEMGVTMLVGLFDCRSGALSMINAGHENPLIVRSDGSVEVLPMRGGPPFCVVDFPYEVETAQLQAGETIVVITDGATEAANEKQELFGGDGVTSMLSNARSASAGKQVSLLTENIRAFENGTDPSDDLTIFALRYVRE